MVDPAQLERHADQLRELARQADVKASTLATQLDSVVRTARDPELWKGPYPAQATSRLEDYRRRLGQAADLLGADAQAWRRRAGTLDDDAARVRREQRQERERREQPQVGPR